MKRLSEPRVLEQIQKLAGNIAAVARAFGVTRQSVRSYIDKRPDLIQALKDSREALVDDAESALQVAVSRCEGWAVCFTLKCLGRGRGYTEKDPTLPPLETILALLPATIAEAVRRELAQSVSSQRDSSGNPTA